MTKHERLKDIKGYVVDLIDSIKAGYEMDGYQAIIKYKDGSVKYISQDDGTDASLNLNKIDYIVYEDPDTSRDSEGKSLNDYCIVGFPIPQEVFDIWNVYVNTMLSK